MTDRVTLAKARKELEDLYLGVPDDSVNLTFQDFAQVSQDVEAAAAKKKKPNRGPSPVSPVKRMDSISESMTPKHDHFTPPHLAKMPSLDFSRGLEATYTPPPSYHHHQSHHVVEGSPVVGLPPGRSYRHHNQAEEVVQHTYNHGDRHDYYGSNGHHVMKNHGHGHGHGHENGHGHGQHGHVVEKSVAYDDMSVMSGMSMTSMYQEKATGRRRPGIPHSNICTVCSVYIYMFRNRCLVCGRVYCRQCMNIGMGEMTEGRKCIDCLGRKFSQRYIHRAGDVGCFSSCFNGYPNGVKAQELKWAERGPRRSGENMYNRSVMMSNTRSPLRAPRTPNRSHIVASGPPSFVTTPEYSPYATPTRHHLPF